MAGFNFTSIYASDCISFSWKWANYAEWVDPRDFYTAGNRHYSPDCSNSLVRNMFFRPTERPCDGCPYYEQELDGNGDPVDKGAYPPNEM
jgi:hypothetical protein